MLLVANNQISWGGGFRPLGIVLPLTVCCFVKYLKYKGEFFGLCKNYIKELFLIFSTKPAILSNLCVRCNRYIFLYRVVFLSPVFLIKPFSTPFFKSRLAVAVESSEKCFI